ncbi:MAG: hypothetical protein A2Z20_01105 [Bdellovibrionales bacterium RBG_16_40_8]|nr:MAG: hypothetical protein A2Z20_01105 [Bdellovibrionales bacterium RBG_16_40_8]
MESKYRTQKLKKSADFARIKKVRSALNLTHWLTAFYCANKDLGLRVGWTVPSYVGPAVIRNRMKRWMREDLSRKGTLSELNLDVNLVLRKKTGVFYRELEHEGMDAAIEELFRKLSRKDA